MSESSNPDQISDEALVTLYGRLSLKYNHLPDALRARAIAEELPVSFPRLKQTKFPAFVNDRLSNEELCDATAAFCSKTGLVEPLTQDQLVYMARALVISAKRFRELIDSKRFRELVGHPLRVES